MANFLLDFCNKNQYISAVEIDGNRVNIYFHIAAAAVSDLGTLLRGHLVSALTQVGHRVGIDEGFSVSHKGVAHVHSQSLASLSHIHIVSDENISQDDMQEIYRALKNFRQRVKIEAVDGSENVLYKLRNWVYGKPNQQPYYVKTLLNNRSLAELKKLVDAFESSPAKSAPASTNRIYAGFKASLPPSCESQAFPSVPPYAICDTTAELATYTQFMRNINSGITMIGLLPLVFTIYNMLFTPVRRNARVNMTTASVTSSSASAPVVPDTQTSVHRP